MRHHDTSVKLADRLCNIAKWVLIYSVVFGNIWGFFSDHMRCADLLIAAGASVAFCAGAAWIFSTRRWQTFVATCFGMQPPVHSTTPIEKTWVWCLVGLLIVIGNLAVVEIAFPFFFTQDDNFSAFLPNVLHAYRNILQGILPTWNPYQYLGIAHASNPQCTFFYPPMFLSYLASRLIFRSEMYTLDIFAWLHLLGGYLIVFLLLRKVEVRPWYAMAGAMAFTLSGFFLILGRGWVSFAYYTVYEALLILQLIALQRGNASWKWLFGTGAIIGLSYYLGCPQMWAYMLLFFTVAVVLMMSSGAVSVRHGLLTVPAVLLGLAVASPLLLPQYQETMRFIQQRTSQLGEGIGHGLLASFFPYPLSFIPYDPRGYSWSQYGPIGWVNGDYQYLTQLYYSGTLFSVIAAVVLLAACGYVVTRCVVQRNVWLGTALIAANLALGAIAGGWLVLSLLPVLSKFRGPFKLIGFLNLFLILGAAIVVERLLRHYRVKQWLEYAGVALVCMLMTYHCLQPHPAFFRFGDKPYPALPATYQPIVTQSHSTTPARIYSFGPYRHGGSNFVWALSLNFPTVYGIPALTGYDPLLSLSPEMTAAGKGIKRSFVSAMQAYGVRWIIMTYHCPQKVRGALLQNPNVTFRQRITDGAPFPIDILEIAHPAPLAFLEETPQVAMPIHLRGDGVAIDLAGSPVRRTVIVNFAPSPFMRARADGIPVPITADAWQRMHITVPPGTRQLRCEYQPNWLLGAVAGVVLAIIASIIGFLLLRGERGVQDGIASPQKETAVLSEDGVL